MPDSNDLTPSERALLVLLMAEARDISNVELKERFGFTLTGKDKDKLNRLKYVESWRQRRAFVHRLAEEGWAYCRRELDFANPRARVLSAALTVLFATIQRDAERTNRSLAEVFAPDLAVPVARESPARPPEGSTAPIPDLAARIRLAYQNLATREGAWVSLADLRSQLDGVSRAEVDAALRQLELEPDINIVPESNQKALSDAERSAGIRIGGQDKHFLAIGV
jgi:hypothetical protein